MGWFKRRCPACDGRKGKNVSQWACVCPGYPQTVWQHCDICHGDGEVDFKYKEYTKKEKTTCGKCGGTGKMIHSKWKTYPDGTERPGTRKEKTIKCDSCNGKGHHVKKVEYWKKV